MGARSGGNIFTGDVSRLFDDLDDDTKVDPVVKTTVG
jgi:hypothetical protein